MNEPKPPRVRNRSPKPPTADADAGIPHHPPLTADGFRDEALQAWLIEYFPDLANLALTGRITNTTQP